MSRASYTLVQATVGVGTVLIWDFCVAITGGGGLNLTFACLFLYVVVFLMVMFVVPHLGFIMSLSWVTPSTHVFYNSTSTGDRVPAIVLGSSLQPGAFLQIQYAVRSKEVVHEAAALHHIGTLGPMGSTKLEIKNCWDTSRCRQQQQTTTITQVAAKTQQDVTKSPLQGRKKHQVSSKGLWQPFTSIWEHPPKWFAVGLFTG